MGKEAKGCCCIGSGHPASWWPARSGLFLPQGLCGGWAELPACQSSSSSPECSGQVVSGCSCCSAGDPLGLRLRSDSDTRSPGPPCVSLACGAPGGLCSCCLQPLLSRRAALNLLQRVEPPGLGGRVPQEGPAWCRVFWAGILPLPLPRGCWTGVSSSPTRVQFALQYRAPRHRSATLAICQPVPGAEVGDTLGCSTSLLHVCGHAEMPAPVDSNNWPFLPVSCCCPGCGDGPAAGTVTRVCSRLCL